jgi:NADPH:quinone reductase-like Zn-dependent oxidoreductase
MKFIEASKFGGPEVLTVVEAPTPTPTERTLLVEIRAAGVNYADIMARSGFYPRVPKAPFPVGFEIAGVVKGIVKGVESFKEGDSVAAIIQSGGYATHAVIPAATAIPLLPDWIMPLPLLYWCKALRLTSCLRKPRLRKATPC